MNYIFFELRQKHSYLNITIIFKILESTSLILYEITKLDDNLLTFFSL